MALTADQWIERSDALDVDALYKGTALLREADHVIRALVAERDALRQEVLRARLSGVGR